MPPYWRLCHVFRYEGFRRVVADGVKFSTASWCSSQDAAACQNSGSGSRLFIDRWNAILSAHGQAIELGCTISRAKHALIC